MSLTRSESDACDLTQQTFYIWATKGHQLRDASKVKTWLFTTLYRAFLQAVALFYLEDYSYKDIAVILNVPIGTVKSRIARGVTKLREIMLTGDLHISTQSSPAASDGASVSVLAGNKPAPGESQMCPSVF